jgi:hypothetical protein
MQGFAVHKSDTHPVEYFDRMRVRVRDSLYGSNVPGANYKNF